jgi:hypothetical protein
MMTESHYCNLVFHPRHRLAQQGHSPACLSSGLTRGTGESRPLAISLDCPVEPDNDIKGPDDDKRRRDDDVDNLCVEDLALDFARDCVIQRVYLCQLNVKADLQQLIGSESLSS